MTRRRYSNVATDATLTNSVSAADTSILLTSASGYPAVPFHAVIGRGASDEEIVLVTALSGSTATATRGADGTSAKSHAAGASFQHAAVALDFDEANAHVNATTGVHGVVGALVDLTSAQTLTNKTLTSPVINGGSGTLSTVTVTTKLTVPTPATGTDAANKTYADGVGSAAITPSAVARRDASGNTAFNRVTVAQAPGAVDEVTRKDYVDAVGTRVTTLEGKTTDTGWLALTPATGWASNGTLSYRKLNGFLSVRVQVNRTGANLPTADGTGNIADIDITNANAGVAASWARYGAGGAPNGVGVGGFRINGDGSISLVSVEPNRTIVNGDLLMFDWTGPAT